MPNQNTYKPLRKVYTLGGDGVGVVIDDELGCFFLDQGFDFSYVEGKPKPGLDGGCYAEEPKYLSAGVLDRWTKEGRITNGNAYKKRLKHAFRKL